MVSPSMEMITTSLERSLQNCSLNHRPIPPENVNAGYGISPSSSSSSSSDSPGNTSAAVELNSSTPLPYHWEQCLDLKTGELYYINWMTGMRAKEDPRTATAVPELSYSENDSSYDSEESSSECSSRETNSFCSRRKEDQVLVVAGCKSCLMYFMVAKQAGVCPKCAGQLLHFDNSQSSSP